MRPHGCIPSKKLIASLVNCSDCSDCMVCFIKYDIKCQWIASTHDFIIDLISKEKPIFVGSKRCGGGGKRRLKAEKGSKAESIITWKKVWPTNGWINRDIIIAIKN